MDERHRCIRNDVFLFVNIYCRKDIGVYKITLLYIKTEKEGELSLDKLAILYFIFSHHNHGRFRETYGFSYEPHMPL